MSEEQTTNVVEKIAREINQTFRFPLYANIEIIANIIRRHYPAALRPTDSQVEADRDALAVANQADDELEKADAERKLGEVTDNSSIDEILSRMAQKGWTWVGCTKGSEHRIIFLRTDVALGGDAPTLLSAALKAEAAAIAATKTEVPK